MEQRGSLAAMMGCTNQVVKCGVCITHGAKVNNHNGCASYAYKGGVCITHGAKAERKLCSHNGCTNQVRMKGVCTTHGALRQNDAATMDAPKKPKRGHLVIQYQYDKSVSTSAT